MNNQQHISIVSPVYRAEGLIDKLVNEIVTNISSITADYEIILVEDGSPDNSWDKIQENCEQNERVKGIKLSRNFGQHYAITAGIEAAKGEWVIVMDCDLQDRPDQFSKLYNKTKEGYNIVFAKRTVRQDTFLKKLSSKAFYKVFSFMTNTNQDASVANFGIYHRKAIKAILSMKDYIRYFPTMSQWVGFSKCSVEVEHGEREEGESSYSWKKLLKLAGNNILAFSDKPLKLTAQLGFFIALLSGLAGIYYLASYFSGYVKVEGFTSLIISVWFLSGLIIFILGMIGVYLGKTFENVKNRPVYIVDETKNI